MDSLSWEGRTGPALNGIADRAGERVPGQTAEEYLVTSVWNAAAFLVPGYTDQMANFGPDEMDANQMTGEQLYSIVAFLCTQGEQSDCDIENNTTAIPAAIKTLFDLEVDITFGMDQDADAKRMSRSSGRRPGDAPETAAERRIEWLTLRDSTAVNEC